MDHLFLTRTPDKGSQKCLCISYHCLHGKHSLTWKLLLHSNWGYIKTFQQFHILYKGTHQFNTGPDCYNILDKCTHIMFSIPKSVCFFSYSTLGTSCRISCSEQGQTNKYIKYCCLKVLLVAFKASVCLGVDFLSSRSNWHGAEVRKSAGFEPIFSCFTQALQPVLVRTIKSNTMNAFKERLPIVQLTANSWLFTPPLNVAIRNGYKRYFRRHLIQTSVFEACWPLKERLHLSNGFLLVLISQASLIHTGTVCRWEFKCLTESLHVCKSIQPSRGLKKYNIKLNPFNTKLLKRVLAESYLGSGAYATINRLFFVGQTMGAF